MWFRIAATLLVATSCVNGQLTQDEVNQFTAAGQCTNVNNGNIAPKLTASLNNDVTTINANHVPTHPWQKVNPNEPKAFETDYVFKTPKKLAPGQEICLNQGPIGIAKNGVFIYNPTTACGGDAKYDEDMDFNHGHSDPSGAYHYHYLPDNKDVWDVDNSRVSQFIGVAFDGYPIYSKADGFDMSKLDVCHGMEVRGKYRYIATADHYPYFMGCYRGQPQVQGAGGSASCAGMKRGQSCTCEFGIASSKKRSLLQLLKKLVKETDNQEKRQNSQTFCGATGEGTLRIGGPPNGGDGNRRPPNFNCDGENGNNGSPGGIQNGGSGNPNEDQGQGNQNGISQGNGNQNNGGTGNFGGPGYRPPWLRPRPGGPGRHGPNTNNRNDGNGVVNELTKKQADFLNDIVNGLGGTEGIMNTVQGLLNNNNNNGGGLLNNIPSGLGNMFGNGGSLFKKSHNNQKRKQNEGNDAELTKKQADFLNNIVNGLGGTQGIMDTVQGLFNNNNNNGGGLLNNIPNGLGSMLGNGGSLFKKSHNNQKRKQNEEHDAKLTKKQADFLNNIVNGLGGTQGIMDTVQGLFNNNNNNNNNAGGLLNNIPNGLGNMFGNGGSLFKKSHNNQKRKQNEGNDVKLTKKQQQALLDTLMSSFGGANGNNAGGVMDNLQATLPGLLSNIGSQGLLNSNNGNPLNGIQNNLGSLFGGSPFKKSLNNQRREQNAKQDDVQQAHLTEEQKQYGELTKRQFDQLGSLFNAFTSGNAGNIAGQLPGVVGQMIPQLGGADNPANQAGNTLNTVGSLLGGAISGNSGNPFSGSLPFKRQNRRQEQNVHLEQNDVQQAHLTEEQKQYGGLTKRQFDQLGSLFNTFGSGNAGNIAGQIPGLVGQMIPQLGGADNPTGQAGNTLNTMGSLLSGAISGNSGNPLGSLFPFKRQNRAMNVKYEKLKEELSKRQLNIPVSNNPLDGVLGGGSNNPLNTIVQLLPQILQLFSGGTNSGNIDISSILQLFQAASGFIPGVTTGNNPLGFKRQNKAENAQNGDLKRELYKRQIYDPNGNPIKGLAEAGTLGSALKLVCVTQSNPLLGGVVGAIPGNPLGGTLSDANDPSNALLGGLCRMSDNGQIPIENIMQLLGSGGSANPLSAFIGGSNAENSPFTRCLERIVNEQTYPSGTNTNNNPLGQVGSTIEQVGGIVGGLVPQTGGTNPAAGIGSIFGGLGGLFSKRQNKPTDVQNDEHQQKRSKRQIYDPNSNPVKGLGDQGTLGIALKGLCLSKENPLIGGLVGGGQGNPLGALLNNQNDPSNALLGALCRMSSDGEIPIENILQLLGSGGSANPLSSIIGGSNAANSAYTQCLEEVVNGQQISSGTNSNPVGDTIGSIGGILGGVGQLLPGQGGNNPVSQAGDTAGQIGNIFSGLFGRRK